MLPRSSNRLKERAHNLSQPSQSVTTTTTQHPHKSSQTAPTRLRKKQKLIDTAHENQTEHKNNVKKQVNHNRVKGRRGKLRNINEMPMDILLEIFSQLQPVDLLHLSRANKDLRSILLSSGSAFLWTMAFKSATPCPPPLYPGRTFVQYANFLYGRHCYFCPSVHGNILHWPSQVRLCSKCVPEQLLAYNQIATQSGLEAFRVCCQHNLRKPGGHATGSYCLKIEYDRKVSEMKSRMGDEAAIRDFIEHQGNIKAARERHAREVWLWFHHQRAARSTNLYRMREKRRLDIVERIQAEGYGPELQGIYVPNLPGVRVAKELTDRDWERIKPNIINALDYKRQEALGWKIMGVFRKRLDQLNTSILQFTSDMPQPRILPTVLDFARSAPFCELLKNTAIEEELDAKILENLIPNAVELIVSWRESADELLLGLLPKPTGRSRKARRDTSQLGLATTFFKCHWCTEPISYPRILMHNCLRGRRSDPSIEVGEDDSEEQDGSEGEDEGDADPENEDEGSSSKEQEAPSYKVNTESVWNKVSSWYGGAWNEGNDQVTHDQEASSCAKVIIKVCGEDPETTTYARMDEIDARLECVRCGLKSKASRLVMNWTTAILHELDSHFEEPPAESDWRKISDEDVIKAKESESKSKVKGRAAYYQCNRCHHIVSKIQASSHLLGSHNIDVEIDDELAYRQEFYLAADHPMKRPPYAVRIL
ncbi:hypothetical protein B0H34DRAFT_695953 [Crassisporium funariophilum]|nr:hypothetical protein B0H34DRAFT_695953 [Crassisporium funariophilum]